MPLSREANAARMREQREAEREQRTAAFAAVARKREKRSVAAQAQAAQKEDPPALQQQKKALSQKSANMARLAAAHQEEMHSLRLPLDSKDKVFPGPNYFPTVSVNMRVVDFLNTSRAHEYVAWARHLGINVVPSNEDVQIGFSCGIVAGAVVPLLRAANLNGQYVSGSASHQEIQSKETTISATATRTALEAAGTFSQVNGALFSNTTLSLTRMELTNKLHILYVKALFCRSGHSLSVAVCLSQSTCTRRSTSSKEPAEP